MDLPTRWNLSGELSVPGRQRSITGSGWERSGRTRPTSQATTRTTVPVVTAAMAGHDRIGRAGVAERLLRVTPALGAAAVDLGERVADGTAVDAGQAQLDEEGTSSSTSTGQYVHLLDSTSIY
jgi:hypothetical protein